MSDKETSHDLQGGTRQWWMYGAVSFGILFLLLGCFGIPVLQNYSRMEELQKIVADLNGKTKVQPGRLLNWLPLDWNTWVQKKVGEKWVDALSTVESIRISSQEINDTHLRFISDFEDLVDIDLSETNITDDGLFVVRRMPSLENLWICNTSVDGSGFAELENLTSLKDLSLSNTNVSDESLVHLKGLNDLEFLYLNNTQVGDDGLKHLIGHSKLQRLHLGNTRVTQQGISKLKAALPDCEIHF